MRYKINEGDYFQLKNKDYCVVLAIFSHSYKFNDVRYRVVKSCKGKYSKKSRIGKPYTYQLESSLSNFKKRILKKVTHEDILKLLFKQKETSYLKEDYIDMKTPDKPISNMIVLEKQINLWKEIKEFFTKSK